MSLNQLLIQLSKELSLPDLGLNRNGVCQLSIDERVVLTIEDAPREASVHVYATVGHAPGSGRETLFQTLLEAQLFCREIGEGIAFGFDGATSEILLCKKMRLSTLDVDSFSAALSEITAWTEYWQSKINQPSDPSSSVSESEVPHFFIRA